MGGRAHSFGLGMVMGEPGWSWESRDGRGSGWPRVGRGAGRDGCGPKALKRGARGDFSRTARVMMGAFLRRIGFFLLMPAGMGGRWASAVFFGRSGVAVGESGWVRPQSPRRGGARGRLEPPTRLRSGLVPGGSEKDGQSVM